METIPGFGRKKCASDRREYRAAEAEGRNLEYMVENACIHCNRLIRKEEMRILPPSYLQERDPYVSSGVVRRRVMCLNCYNLIRSTCREKASFDRHRQARARPQLFRSALKILTSR